MSIRIQLTCAACCLLLAGCATSSRQNAYKAADWQDIDLTPVTAAPAAKTNQPITPGPKSAPFNPPALPKTTTTKPELFETWVPIQRWSRVNGLMPPTRLSTAPLVTYALKSTNGVFVLSGGTQFARWDGLDLRLGFAPQVIDGQLYVHGLDLKKTIEPLLKGERRLLLGSNPILVIDPGHGGENAGTRSVLGDRYEKDFTLDWALRLRGILQAKGWQVYLTRSNDTDLALSNRVAFAAEHKAGLFLSLHFNSAGQETEESGLETYCLTPVGMPSSLTRGFADEINQPFPNNAYDTQNLLLAMSVHRSLLQVNGHQDRGVRRARFPGVLRGQERPAVLVEGGYLSSPHEARLISDPSYRQKLAEAVARGLEGYGPQPVAHTTRPAQLSVQAHPSESPPTGGAQEAESSP